MSDHKSLLVELFVEELPPKALKKLGEAFGQALLAGLRTQGLAGEHSALNVYASPRRLAAHISGVLPAAADKSVSQKLMPVAVALDASGAPTPALLKKLAALGVDASVLPALQRQPDGKAEALFFSSVQPGAMLAAGLQVALTDAIHKLPIPKLMQYQLADGWTTVHFVRPAHGLVALHGSDVVPVSALGLQAGRTTWGHRFLSTGAIALGHADKYAEVLHGQGKVIASFESRRQVIRDQLDELTRSSESDGVIAPDALLDEVAALVEWPAVYVCHFDDAFLLVPQECLILTMQTNQKYFACTLEQSLVSRFLVVSNIETEDSTAIVQGNERVIRPRLADAKFFFDQDRKTKLEDRVPKLAKVVYHGKLGNQLERVGRVRNIARAIAQQMGSHELAEKADRTAYLAKADLLTDMVGEFPELQGVMGWYYARHDLEDDDVAMAIEDHYKPRFAGDSLPRNEVGVVVALADKLETLAGLFGIGQLPTGDKDPFALRRHALGVVRMLVERGLALSVPALVQAAFEAFPAGHGAAQADVQHFLYDRLIGYLRELGYSANEVEAVIALRPPAWAELPKRLAAVQAFAKLPEAPALAAANKRVGNILKKSEAAAVLEVKPSLLIESAEVALFVALAEVAPKADASFAAGDYTASLQTLAALKGPVDAFFDAVMVNAEDAALRANRLALLRALQAAMNRVADLSKLAA